VTLVHQAFRFELDPGTEQRDRLASHAGASRFAYNWGLVLVKARLDQREEIRRAGYRELLCDEETAKLVGSVEVPWTLASLRKEWNQEKHVVAPWWSENSKEAYSSGLDALARGLDGFSKARRGARSRSVGFPRFKKRGGRRSCRFTTGAIKVTDDRHIQLPRIGIIRTKEHTTALGELVATRAAAILSATISEEAGRWFVSFGCELERSDEAAFSAVIVGVDLGVKVLAALSTGEVIENPKPLTAYQRRMARLSHELSRRQRGSKRRAVTKDKLARCHSKVANARRDGLHQLTTALASTYRTWSSRISTSRA
jgi:putative transposase